MRVRFTEHSRIQLLARGILESTVLEAVRHPDTELPAPGNAYAYRKQFTSGILEAICVRNPQKNEWLVLTAYYLKPI
jgi:hypothetical protein